MNDIRCSENGTMQFCGAALILNFSGVICQSASVIQYIILETKGWLARDGTISDCQVRFASVSSSQKFQVIFGISCRQIANQVAKFRKLPFDSPPLCFRSGRLIFIWGIVPITLISDNRWGARLIRAVAGRAVLKWKFCQLQSELQEGAAAPSDDLRPRPLQRWRVRQSGTANVFFTNHRVTVIS